MIYNLQLLVATAGNNGGQDEPSDYPTHEKTSTFKAGAYNRVLGNKISSFKLYWILSIWLVYRSILSSITISYSFLKEYQKSILQNNLKEEDKNNI
jgi:hypothetical protein